HRLLSSRGNRYTTILASFATFLSFIVLAFGHGPMVIGAFILYFMATNFIIASLDIFVEDFSQNSSIGKFRGYYLAISSLSWVVAQMISGSVISKSSYSGIYSLSSVFIVLFALIFAIFLRDFKDPKYKKMHIRKTIKVFFSNKNISRIYFINLILRFFFAWMIIYTPIYLHQYIGFDWQDIGFIFTIMLIPFVILEPPLGQISDKIGEKKLLALGFIICAVSTFIIPLLTFASVALWAFVLFMTRVGAATIEIMSESYFFKSIKKEDDGETAFFRNTTPLSFIVGPMVATPLLLVLPSFEYLFFVLGAVLLLGMMLTLRLQDVK
ncbi:MFS transporter, partial [Patescibacteria group bacterium]|nr:MFS transporter [Patescibacteria group bacterium]